MGRPKKKREGPKITNFMAIIPGNIRPPRNRVAKKFICGYKKGEGQIIFFNGSGRRVFSLPFREGKLKEI